MGTMALWRPFMQIGAWTIHFLKPSGVCKTMTARQTPPIRDQLASTLQPHIMVCPSVRMHTGYTTGLEVVWRWT